ncbi:hypothetical protein [Streptomyces sp. NPDC001100]
MSSTVSRGTVVRTVAARGSRAGIAEPPAGAEFAVRLSLTDSGLTR